jgi:hypothetical protein
MKPFLTKKGSKDGSSIMIKTEDTVKTKPKVITLTCISATPPIGTLYQNVKSILRITPVLRT